MQEYPNLYIDLSFFATRQGVEMLVEKLGSERIVFGTVQLLVDGGRALMHLSRAMINGEDAQMIAGRNLQNLLDRVLLGNHPLKWAHSSVQMASPRFSVGLDLHQSGIEITDAHVHMEPYHKFYIPENSARDMLRVMDQLHIS